MVDEHRVQRPQLRATFRVEKRRHSREEECERRWARCCSAESPDRCSSCTKKAEIEDERRRCTTPRRSDNSIEGADPALARVLNPNRARPSRRIRRRQEKGEFFYIGMVGV